jgi:ribosomal protein S8
MVNAASKFVSLFNFGVLTSKRIANVSNSAFSNSILNLLKSQGYILSYARSPNDSAINVYYNFSCLKFKLILPPRTTRRFISHDKLRTFANAGRVFIIATNSGYMFSDFALINNLGGFSVLELKFILNLFL